MKILINGKLVDTTSTNVATSAPVQQSVSSTIAASVALAAVPNEPALTIDTVSTRFSVRLPAKLALQVRESVQNYNNFFAALIQSYFENRIDKTEVYYVER
jgi:hypothetical protein